MCTNIILPAQSETSEPFASITHDWLTFINQVHLLTLLIMTDSRSEKLRSINKEDELRTDELVSTVVWWAPPRSSNQLNQHVCLGKIIFESLPVIHQADDDKEEQQVALHFKHCLESGSL